MTDLSKIGRSAAMEPYASRSAPNHVSGSPLLTGQLGETVLGFETIEALARSLGREAVTENRSVVCVQGLGFVGSAMAVALADARDAQGNPYFNVVGVELPTPEGLEKVEAINAGQLPIATADVRLQAAIARASAVGNLFATTDSSVYTFASVTTVDIHLDVSRKDGRPSVDFSGFRAAIRTLGSSMRPGSLIVVETTTPPGTCEHVVVPEVEQALGERGLPIDSILVAHAYERVMPGTEYLDSIINFWRVYSGHTPEAADACDQFLSKVINVKDFPLTRLMSTTASETAKVLENSFRATTIAFMEEWGRFAEAVGIDIFEIVDAIRVRPTHKNIRQPGFGVGGYCLTKDPHLADVAAREIFGYPGLDFELSQRATEINQAMPIASLDQIEKLLGGSLENKSLLLLGVSYRQDVGDTRYGPSETFVREAERRNAKVECHDPLVTHWQELARDLPSTVPSPEGFDAVVFAVSHSEYQEMDLGKWLSGWKPLVFDANAVLSLAQRRQVRDIGCQVAAIGRGKNCE